MAIDLQNPQNIETGWRGPTQFQAPSGIGEILKNRLLQQEWQQKQIADTIKQYQSQRQASAFGTALQNAGVVPQGVDVSSMSSDDLAKLASQIQEQTPDTDEDNLKKAMAAYYNKLATTGGVTGRGGAKVQGALGPVTPNQGFQELAKQAAIYGSQADQLAQQQQDYGLPADVPGGFGYMKNPDGTLRYAKTRDEVAKPDLVSPTDVLKSGKQPNWAKGAIDPDTGQPMMPFFTPDVYKQRQAQSVSRQQILAEQARIQQQMLGQQGIRQDDVNQTNQAPGMPGAGPSAPPPAPHTGPTPPPQTSVTPPAPSAPDIPGAKIDSGTAGQYLVAAQGNRALAQRRAQADGWTW